ncbi:MAG: hypothetical protein M3441_15760 [Chloroflexota bacterium]|nr:hypothetical protein [Chloroflexota bacterium]
MSQHLHPLLPSRTALVIAILGLALMTACGPAPRRPGGTETPVTNATATVGTTPAATMSATAAVTSTAAPARATNTRRAATAQPTRTSTPRVTSTPTTTPSPEPTLPPPDYSWVAVGLTGTNITGMAVMPGGDNTVLVGGPGGVWKGSYDYTQWQQLTVNLVGRTTDVALGSAEVMYVTSHTGCASGLPIAGSRSTDGGQTWQEMAGLDAIHITAPSASEAFAATCSDVRRTTDAGATWTPLPNAKVENFDPRSIAASPDGQTIFVAFVSEGGSGQVLRSTDGGDTFENVTPELQGEDSLQAPDVMVYVPGSIGRPEDGGLYMTTYQGIWFLPLESDDWTLLSRPVPQDQDPTAYSWFTTLFVDAFYTEEYNKPGPILYTAMAKPSDAGLTSLGVFRSGDGGQSWTPFNKEIGDRAVNVLVLAPHDPTTRPDMIETLLAATNDGIWAIPMPPPYR